MARTEHATTRSNANGFSLLELVIAVTILGIVTAAAVATYSNSMVKTRLGAAQGCLMEAAQFMERAYTLQMTYAGTDFPDLACTIELEDFYTFDFDGIPDADSYVVRASPRGPQLDDTQCGVLAIDQAGVKSADNVDACW